MALKWHRTMMVRVEYRPLLADSDAMMKPGHTYNVVAHDVEDAINKVKRDLARSTPSTKFEPYIQKVEYLGSVLIEETEPSPE